MSNALTLSKPGMWAEAATDAGETWQAVSRLVSLLDKAARHPELAALFDEAMMALDDGVPGGPFTAATDVLHMARKRVADLQQRQQQPDAPRHGTGPGAQFTPNGHDAPKAVAP
jgi:hypothetical protein